jgi:hypothetical protein
VRLKTLETRSFLISCKLPEFKCKVPTTVMNSSETHSPLRVLFLPILVVFDEARLIHMSSTEFRLWSRSCGECGKALFPHASLPNLRVTSLLDRRGHLYGVKQVSKRRPYLRWLAPVWDFTWAECELIPQGQPTVAHLLAAANKWTNDPGEKLRKFLQQKQPGTVFADQMFREAWDATYITLPESEWHQKVSLC